MWAAWGPPAALCQLNAGQRVRAGTPLAAAIKASPIAHGRGGRPARSKSSDCSTDCIAGQGAKVQYQDNLAADAESGTIGSPGVTALPDILGTPTTLTGPGPAFVTW